VLFIDITGHRYARLTVIQKLNRDKRGYFLWLCRCDCGNEITAGANALRSGNTKSCGCFRLERLSEWGKANRTHGESLRGSKDRKPSREYRAWCGMRERCRNPNNKDFAKYGGRGLTVCERWDSSYETFLADMGRCPPGKSLDRIDNDAGYSPVNCRWATLSEQNKNRRPLKRTDEGKFASCHQRFP
jgi:hypothetical protein